MVIKYLLKIFCYMTKMEKGGGPSAYRFQSDSLNVLLDLREFLRDIEEGVDPEHCDAREGFVFQGKWLTREHPKICMYFL